MIDHRRVRIMNGVLQLAPLVLSPTVGKLNATDGLRREQDPPGGRARNRFGVNMIRDSVAAGNRGTDIAEPTLMQDTQRRHGPRLHGKRVNRPLRAAPQQRVRLPALAYAQHPRSNEVTAVEALDGSKGDQLLGYPVRGCFRQPACASQRGKPKALIGMRKGVQHGECTLENPPPPRGRRCDYFRFQWRSKKAGHRTGYAWGCKHRDAHQQIGPEIGNG